MSSPGSLRPASVGEVGDGKLLSHIAACILGAREVARAGRPTLRWECNANQYSVPQAQDPTAVAENKRFTEDPIRLWVWGPQPRGLEGSVIGSVEKRN